MSAQHLPYVGEGEANASFRPASTPPGYTTSRGTVGHYLASPRETAGRFSLYKWDMGPQPGGPGPHFHRTYDETFLIVSGTVHLYDGRRWFDAGAGDLLHVPAGGIHGFTNTSGAPASMLMLITPGVDRGAYFDELAHIATGATEPTVEHWAALMERHDNVMLDLS